MKNMEEVFASSFSRVKNISYNENYLYFIGGFVMSVLLVVLLVVMVTYGYHINEKRKINRAIDSIMSNYTTMQHYNKIVNHNVEESET